MRRGNCWVVDGTKSCSKKKLEAQKKILADDDISKNNALIRFYFKENPELMNDTLWCKRVCELEYVLKKTGILTDAD
jgi:hypothetical protein